MNEIIILICVVCSIFGIVIIFFLKRKCERLAFVDDLTELWNQRKFEREVSRILKNIRAETFVFSDTDFRNFKFINKVYGTSYGDALLRNFSRILKEVVKSHKGFLARGYADHFYIFEKLIPGESADLFLKKMEKKYDGYNIRKLLGIDIKKGIVFIGPEFGYDSVTNLIGKASYAKKSIENGISGYYAVFDGKMEKQLALEQKIESGVDAALETHEFFIVYQPQIRLADGKITGAEALVRWNHTELGGMEPDVFIPVLEKCGYVQRLDFYVYEAVFDFLQRRLDVGQPIVPVSMNMSRYHLDAERFVEQFCSLFSRYSIPPEFVRIEILERSTGYSQNQLKDVTCLLQQNGFFVAIDDFGSGESSLNMLSDIPANMLKLDRKFLKHIDTSADSRKIITKIVELAKELNKITVCEGAETTQQIDFLKSICCDEVQGFYYSKPLPEIDFVTYMVDHM